MNVDLKLMAVKAAAGDRTAFRAIVVHTQDRLYRLACRIMGNTADAEDVLQEGYIKAHRALLGGSFEGRSSTVTWLHRIVTHCAIDTLRARDRRRESSTSNEDAEHPTARFDQGVTAEQRLALEELGALLEGLPPRQRAAVVLQAVEGHTTQEVAEIMELSPGAVEQLLVRARATLRERKDDHD